jgi:hypothetical protein
MYLRILVGSFVNGLPEVHKPAEQDESVRLLKLSLGHILGDLHQLCKQNTSSQTAHKQTVGKAHTVRRIWVKVHCATKNVVPLLWFVALACVSGQRKFWHL